MLIKTLKNLLINSSFAFKNNKLRVYKFLVINLVPLNYILAFFLNNLNSELSYKFYNKINKLKFFGKGYIRYINLQTRKNIFYKIRNASNLSRDSKYTNQILKNGFVSLGKMFLKKEAEEFIKDIKNKHFFNSQVPSQSSKIISGDKIFSGDSEENFFCLHPELSLKSKQLKKIFNNNFLKKIADEYCGYSTSLYSVNTFFSRPTKKKILHYVQRVHRDYDNISNLTFFVCWTKTSKSDGATLYYKMSHLKNLKNYKIVPLSGKVGEVFAVDTYGLHCGNLKIKNIRIASWIRYGEINNYASLSDSSDLMKSYKNIISNNT